jgi:hypothetical protein
MSWWYVSSPVLTCLVKVEDDVIVEGAPILQRFVGQPAKSLGGWLRGQGDCRFERVPDVYQYSWGNNPKRATLKGRTCRVLARGEMRSVMVEFENGQREIVSYRALRERRT